MLTAAANGVPPDVDQPAALAQIGVFAIYMVLATILQAALIRVAIRDLNGQKPTFSDTLGRAVTVAVPIIGLSLLIYLGIGVGFLLLIVPGIYLALRWSVAIPVLVQERCGILKSLSRSAVLTKGSRWRILALIMIFFVAVFALQLVLGLIVGGVAMLIGGVLGAFLMAALSTVSTVVLSISMAVSYIELRYVKEGTDVNELREIFA